MLSLALDNQIANRRRQLEQAHHVRYMTARLVHELAQFRRTVAERLGQLPVGLGFFYCIEVLSLDILQQSDFERFSVVEMADNGRNVMELRALGSAPAALASNDLIGIIEWTHHNRLQHAMFCDARCQFRQLVVTEMAPGLMGVGVNCGHGQGRGALPDSAIVGLRPGSIRIAPNRLSQQGIQTPAQPHSFAQGRLFTRFISRHAAISRAGSLPINSRARFI